MKQRRYSSPRRIRTPQEQLRKIRIHTEGKITEPGYLNMLGRLYRHKVYLDIGTTGQGPKSLVEQACQDEDERRRRRRRRRRPTPPYDYDEIWCMFDVDEHPEIKQSVNRARQKKGVEVAVSNPCFELWLVLHQKDQTAHIERKDVQQLAQELGLIKDKRIDNSSFNFLLEKYEDAKRRAIELDRWHEGNGSPPRSNPSTGVWRLVDSIRDGRAKEDTS